MHERVCQAGVGKVGHCANGSTVGRAHARWNRRRCTTALDTSQNVDCDLAWREEIRGLKDKRERSILRAKPQPRAKMAWTKDPSMKAFFRP
jgi:hypothetical protein